MKILFLSLLCISATLAIAERRSWLRPEEHWRPATPRDISSYRPRHEFYSGEVSPIETEQQAELFHLRRSPNSSPSSYNLAEECGIPGPTYSSRIVGGEEATPHQFPWMVGVFVGNGGFCGGSLISERWVLTAGHCVHGGNFWDILAGGHHILEEQEPHRIEITSYTGFTHEDYNVNRNGNNDIALIELPEDLLFNEYIRPICLPKPGQEVTTGDLLSVIGWGKMSDDDWGMSSVLNMVHDVPTMDDEKCNEFYFGTLGPGVVCLDTKGGKSSCAGDSGGPLMSKSEESRRPGQIWTQVGIVSFGAPAGCEAGAPAGFTRTEYYRQWIFSNSGV